MDKRIIFWDGNKTIIHTEELMGPDVKNMGLLNKMMVDEFSQSAYTMYGYYDDNRSWKHAPFNEFPKEFKMALMLLGHAEEVKKHPFY